MGSQAFTIFLLFFCGIWYTLAFFQIPKRRFTIGVSIIICCGILLRLYMAYDFQLNEWDESYHALVAKNMMNDFMHPTLYNNPVLDYNFKDWTGNHTWLHRQPLPLWSAALSMQIFGINEIAFRLPSILLSIVSMVILYRLTTELFSKEAGLWATFFFSIHAVLLEFVAGKITADHFDVFFICFFLAAVYFSVLFFKRQNWWWNIFAGLAIGLAYLSNSKPAIFALILWLVMAFLQKHKHWTKYSINLGILVGVALLVALPWQIHVYKSYPIEAEFETQTNFFKFFAYDKNHIKPYYFYFLNSIPELFGNLIVLPLIWYVYHALKRPNHPIRWTLTIWMLAPLFFFSFATTKMHSYVMLTAPAYFMLMGVFIIYMYLRAQVMQFKMLAYGIIAIIIALPLFDSVKRFSPQEDVNKNPAWVVEMKEIGEQMKNQRQTVIFNVERAVDLMFYTDCIAYNYEVDEYTKAQLETEGYIVYDNFVDAYLSLK